VLAKLGPKLTFCETVSCFKVSLAVFGACNAVLTAGIIEFSEFVALHLLQVMLHHLIVFMDDIVTVYHNVFLLIWFSITVFVTGLFSVCKLYIPQVIS